ncbi:hypothetical protein COU18_01910 [Candidatus Kaiserbacteria bacterium CG10_big_fil_rev_8_21_14_0_10_51_14]|uniref:Uncharacterized protein n=1 Tax=Candidatus Kaiserbacteria bacterium CG10_big_fil_rev_8_21_14_0_10_51_14 TaxID=1974610 RepID=A0A2H0UBV3_9BACT|nr:MAG: hypothetical protein COU18_01910 [Candidatus Kaiserbacteria bacterium CG10_big_fil_rev_8_21_14_0_10_51_14]
MPDELVVKHVYPPLDDQVRLKLTKNSKGYGWEISVAGKSGDDALAQMREIEQKVREEFGMEEER